MSGRIAALIYGAFCYVVFFATSFIAPFEAFLVTLGVPAPSCGATYR